MPIMSEAIITHVGFSDESNWNQGRFRSLGLITTSVKALEKLDEETRILLHGSNVREFKWKKLDGAKERFAAIKLCQLAIKASCKGNLRVDVLIWDIEDSRHRILKRDDVANLQRMYYHLFKNVLRARWPNQANWKLIPDEHTAMDWNTVEDCLKNVSTSLEIKKNLFTGGKFKVLLKRDFGIIQIKPSSSCEHPLLNIIDLFAGLAAFSYEKYDSYERWARNQSPQKELFGKENEENGVRISRISEERFKVLYLFNSECKKHRLGVSLKTKRGLWTPNPSNPINFWIYEVQHSLDQAPRRGAQ